MPHNAVPQLQIQKEGLQHLLLCALSRLFGLPCTGLTPELRELISTEGWEAVVHGLQLDYSHLNAEQVLKVRSGSVPECQ